MKFASFVWLIIISIVLILLIGSIWFLNSDYNDIISFAIAKLKRPDLTSMLENRFFTLEKFNYIKLFLKVLIPFLVVSIGALINYRVIVQSILYKFLKSFYVVFQRYLHHLTSSSKNTKIALSLLLFSVLIRSIYFATNAYAQYDESWNYNYFLDGSILKTLFAYNNYSLHNLITKVSLSVFPTSTLTMRLPVIILGLINITFVYVLFKKLFKSELLGLFAGLFFSVIPTVLFFMLFSRGVLLSLFFTLIIIYYFFVKSINSWTIYDLLWASIFAALGSYSMISFPVFIIILSILFIIILIIKNDILGIKKLIAFCLCASILTIMFYMPIFLGSGIDVAINSDFNLSVVDFKFIKWHIELTSLDMIGFYYGSYFIVIINLILLKTSKKYLNLKLFSIILLMIPIFVPLIMRLFLPGRALGFLILPYLFTFIILLNVLLNSKFKKWTIHIGLAICVFFSFHSINQPYMNSTRAYDKDSYNIAQILIANNIKIFYSKSTTFHYNVPGIIYYHLISNHNIIFQTNNKKSSRYTLEEEYKGTCFIIDKSKRQEEGNFKTLYEWEDFILINKN